MPLYSADSGNSDYSYLQPAAPARIQVLERSPGSCRPLEDMVDLSARIFTEDDRTDSDACDFLSDQATVERQQIEILLQQIAARHYISYEVRADLQYREGQLAMHSGALESHCSGDYGIAQANSDFNRKLADLHKERNMEAVSVWRDTQKALTELFRHWTAYTNLARRARVIDLDL